MTLEFIVWDVQHGSAAYIQTPNRKHIVVDLGSGNYTGGNRAFSPLLYLQNQWGVQQLDEVIITHPHIDHIDDILSFDRMKPRALRRPSHLTEKDIWANNREADRYVRTIIQSYLEIEARYSYPLAPEENPEDANNNGGANIQTFTPHTSSRSNLNNHSIVTVVEYAGNKILLPGDNEPSSWKELLEGPNFRSAISGTDILVAPHHGRDSGYCADLFDYIRPKLTLISDGRFLDTSATDRYAAVTSGWTVHRRNAPDIQRKCLTTRNDGAIHVRIGRDQQDGRRFISVTIGQNVGQLYT